MKRRDFIRESTIGSVAGGIGLYGLARKRKAAAATDIPGEGQPLVTIAASNESVLNAPAPLDVELSYDQVREIVWLALDRDTSPGSLVNIVSPESRVVIKTNIVRVVWLSQEGYYGRPGLAPDFEREGDALALVTDLRAVKAVVEYLIEKIAPRRITIAEGPAEWYNAEGNIKPGDYIDGWHYEFEGFDNLSYVKIVNQLDGKRNTTVDIVDLNEDEGIYVTDFDPCNTGIQALQFCPPGDRDGTSDENPTRRKGVFMPRTVLDADVLITMPVMKTHASVGTTLFMKNFIGCVHSTSYDPVVTHKGVFHKGSDLNLVRGIVDLACAINADYGVAEGFWAVKSHHSGQMGIGFNHNVVIAGGDIVAAEAITNQAMGFNPLDFDILRWANMKKLGEWRPARISTAGPSVTSIEVNYARASNKYVARGIRKWRMLGPLREPLEEAGGLTPAIGDRTSGAEWTLLDGDSIIDDLPLVESKSYKECLLYPIPGSDSTDEDSLYYLSVSIHGMRKGIVGQLLVGITGGSFRAFVNGRERSYTSTPYAYNPTPSTFITVREGENTLLLEVRKTNERNHPVNIAVNICDLDGDRLEDIAFDPAGE